MPLSLFFETPVSLVAHLQKKVLSSTIGFLSGEFDLFQAAHLITLHRAKSQCDFLIVGLFPDEFIENKYGIHRPLCQLLERAEMLLGTRYVDAVINLSCGIEDFLKIVKPNKILEFTSPQMVTKTSYPAFARSKTRKLGVVPVESLEIPIAEGIATENAFSRIAEKLGLSSTSTLQSAELMSYLQKTISVPILATERLSVFIADHLPREEKLITTNGSFDLLHLGHLRYLQQAKALGGVLLVLVNDDQSIRTRKGPQRPIFNQEDRTQALAALQSVDYVVPFSGETPLVYLAQIKPDLHIKGGSFEEKWIAKEKELVESYGGQWRSLNLIGNYSSTTLLNRFTSLYNRRKTR